MAERLALPPETVVAVDDKGRLTPAWRAFVQGVFKRLGGSVDNVASALLLSLAAVTGIQIVASGGLQFGGSAVGGAIPIALYRYKGPVSGLPLATDTPPPETGDHAFATDGRNSGEGAGLGTGCEVIWVGNSLDIWRINGTATAVTA